MEALDPLRESNDWAAWRNHLLQQRDHLEDATHARLYVLVDGRACEELATRVRRIPRLRHISLWQGTELASLDEVAPRLIRLDGLSSGSEATPTERLAARIFDDPSAYLATWFWSTADMRDLAGHFARYTYYVLDDRRSFYLHFYDNRILERLRAVWSPEQASAFVSPCLWVAYRQRAGGHAELPVPGEGDA